MPFHFVNYQGAGEVLGASPKTGVHEYLLVAMQGCSHCTKLMQQLLAADTPNRHVYVLPLGDLKDEAVPTDNGALQSVLELVSGPVERGGGVPLLVATYGPKRRYSGAVQNIGALLSQAETGSGAAAVADDVVHISLGGCGCDDDDDVPSTRGSQVALPVVQKDLLLPALGGIPASFHDESDSDLDSDSESDSGTSVSGDSDYGTDSEDDVDSMLRGSETVAYRRW
jgi:hypothetical protein